MLAIEHLHVQFEDGFDVLEDISLTAGDGEFVCVLGPSGCGKTVLLYTIAGFLQPTSGTIVVDGVPVSTPGRDRAMVFQDYVLLPWKSVYGNVEFALEKAALRPKQKHEIVVHYLNLVGLSAFHDWPVYKLSGGMQQRVAIARALAVDPKILLMDEPFVALDSQYRRFLRQNVVEIWHQTKKTVVFVTHSINEALFLADRIYVLTARPARIKAVYEVRLPRPRARNVIGHQELFDRIERDISDEFAKTVNEQALTASIDTHLPVNLRKS